VLTKKKKITRKEIKEDKLVTTYYKTLEFIDEYKKQIYIYGGTLLVIIAVVYWYMNNKAKNDEKATTELAKVLDIYERGAYQEAIDGVPANNITGLKKIVEDYGSTNTGEAAKIFLADCYSSLGKIDEAYKYYDDYSGSNKIYKATALAGKAGYYESKNEYQKAAEEFNKASRISDDNALNAEYLLKAGIDYLHSGDKGKASEVLKKVKEDYKMTYAARDVDRYLVLAEEKD
jgi:tetratricopeptide (TPR) repeat protein